MSFHPEKCQALCMSRCRKKLERQHYLHGQALQEVKHTKYLGVMLTSDNTWRLTPMLSPTKQVGPWDCSGRLWHQVSKGTTSLQVLCQTTSQVCLLHVGPSQHQAHQELRGYLVEGCSSDPAQVPQNFKYE